MRAEQKVVCSHQIRQSIPETGEADLACASRAHHENAEFAHVDGGVLIVGSRDFSLFSQKFHGRLPA